MAVVVQHLKSLVGSGMLDHFVSRSVAFPDGATETRWQAIESWYKKKIEELFSETVGFMTNRGILVEYHVHFRAMVRFHCNSENYSMPCTLPITLVAPAWKSSTVGPLEPLPSCGT